MATTVLLKEIIKEYSVRNKALLDYPVYSVTNSQGFCTDYFGKEVASKDKSTYKIVPYGCFAYNPSRINVGSIDWQHCEKNVIVSPLYNVFSVDESRVKQEFLLYFFKSRVVSLYINTLAKGSVRMNLSLRTLGEFPILLPSIAEQERIIAELDLLSNTIAKERKQLVELDNLTKALFYKMFGDPVTNDYGWVTSSLKGVCERLYAGGDVPKERFSKEKTDQYCFPILSNGKGDSALYGYTDVPRESAHSITISGRGTIGYSCIRTEPFFPIIRLIVAVPSHSVNIEFLQMHLSLMEFESTGGTIPQLTVPMVKDRMIILPPHSLQQDFANIIKPIEKQRELIGQSIREVESLFNGRMDHWFN